VRRRHVWSRNFKNDEAMARVRPQGHRKKKLKWVNDFYVYQLVTGSRSRKNGTEWTLWLSSPLNRPTDFCFLCKLSMRGFLNNMRHIRIPTCLLWIVLAEGCYVNPFVAAFVIAQTIFQTDVFSFKLLVSASWVFLLHCTFKFRGRT